MTTKQQPAYRAFTVTGAEDQAFWTCIGAAWPRRNGEGFSIELTALPLDGRIALMSPKPRCVGHQGPDDARDQRQPPAYAACTLSVSGAE